MTDAELQGIAAQALNLAKLDLERGRFNFLLAAYNQGRLQRMGKVEAVVIQTLGENWLNSGYTKDAGFDVFRLATDLMPPEALVFASVVNKFKPTKKLLASEELRRKLRAAKSHDEHHEFVRQGLLTVNDAVTCCAQTSERVCMYTHDYDPKRREFIGHPEVKFAAQADFHGRMKMYGAEVDRC